MTREKITTPNIVKKKKKNDQMSLTKNTNNKKAPALVQ